MSGEISPSEPSLGEEEKKAVEEVLDSGQIAAGPKVEEFEEEFADYIGVDHAVAMSSGTQSLHAALLASGIEPGDKVIVSPYSFFASVSPVLMIGAEPVFADIDPETYCLDPDAVEEVADENTEALIPVHLYGHPADMERINDVADEYGMTVIEDSCQAHGAELDGKKTGSLGDMGCFSFYATKNMITGEGGMLTTDKEEIAEKARLLREHGQKRWCEHVMVGYNYLMTDIEAAIGLEQLKKLDEMNEQRRKNAEVLDDGLEGMEDAGRIKRPVERDKGKHVYHQYALRITEGDKQRIVKGLQKGGVGARKGYVKTTYDQDVVDFDGELQEAKRAVEEVMWLPIQPKLGASDMSRITWGIQQLLKD